MFNFMDQPKKRHPKTNTQSDKHVKCQGPKKAKGTKSDGSHHSDRPNNGKGGKSVPALKSDKDFQKATSQPASMAEKSKPKTQERKEDAVASSSNSWHEPPQPLLPDPEWTRQSLASCTTQTYPSLDSLPSVVGHQGGRRKGHSKGGKTGKMSALIATSERESAAQEAGLRDAEYALQQKVYEYVSDAMMDLDSPYITESTREGYYNCLEALNILSNMTVDEDAILAFEDGVELDAIVQEPHEVPLVCTSAMRDPTSCADPWSFSMTMNHDRPTWLARFVVSKIKQKFPVLETATHLHHLFSTKISSLMKHVMVDILIAISLKKWPLMKLPGWLSSKVTSEMVNAASNCTKWLGPMGWLNGQLIGRSVMTFAKIAPLIPAALAVSSLVRFGYEVATGSHTNLVKYDVVRLPDDESCISAACNEHRDLRSLTSGKVDRSRCGCFSKVRVTTVNSTFGVPTTSSRDVHISDEVFANVAAMDMLRPALTLEENIKRLRNSTGITHYINLNRGDKQQSLAATIWLAELKLTSEWKEHRSLIEESGLQLE